MSNRVYVATSWTGLRAFVTSDGIGPAPFFAHAVTDELRAAYPEGDEETWEYVALAAAARTSLELLGDEAPARRVVLAVDVPAWRGTVDPDPTVVEVDGAVPFRDVAAVLVDTDDAVGDVTEARARLADADRGDGDAQAAVERCLDRDLAWYATQEIGELLTWE